MSCNQQVCEHDGKFWWTQRFTNYLSRRAQASRVSRALNITHYRSLPGVTSPPSTKTHTERVVSRWKRVVNSAGMCPHGTLSLCFSKVSQFSPSITIAGDNQHFWWQFPLFSKDSVAITSCCCIRCVRFGLKFGQICTKWNIQLKCTEYLSLRWKKWLICANLA